MDQDLIEVVGQTLVHQTEGLICAYLFGSRARGTQSPDSDVDIALLFERDPPRTLEGLQLDLADELTGALARSVDLVVLNRAPPDLIHRVLRDGILLLDRDPGARIRFEVRARNDYFDLLPHLRRYRRIDRGRAA
jgi:predicted nucleotidyltransferase